MLWMSPAGAYALENDRWAGQSALGASFPERVDRRLFGGIDHNVRAEAITGQRAAVGLVVGHDDWFDAARGQRGDGR